MCGPLSRNQSNSVACKEAAAIRGCANAATAMAHWRGTFCAERCGESATDHVRINGLPGSGMLDVTKCRELATECRQMADRAQTFRVRSILIEIERLRREFVALNHCVQPIEEQGPGAARIEEPQAERKVWKAVDALNLIVAARANIINSEHELSAIRARIDAIERDAISREEMKPWIKQSS